MKKLAGVFLGLIIVGIVFYGVWVQTPAIKRPSRVAKVVASAQERWDRQQAQAGDPALNGFLNPTFLPYWGRRDIESDDHSPSSKTVMAWNAYSTLSADRPIDHRALQSDTKYRQALADFQKLEPALVEAMSKPVFTLPETPKSDAGTIFPNFIRLRGAAIAALGLAEARVAQGKPEDAARLVGKVARFGHTISSKTCLIQDLIGLGIRQMAGDGFVALLGPDSQMPASQWKALAHELLAALPDNDQVSGALEGEFSMGVNTLSSPTANLEVLMDSPFARLAAKLPGFLEREKRIYCNMMVDNIMPALEKNLTATLPEQLAHPTASDYFTGRTGIFCEIFVADYTKATYQFAQSRKRLACLTLVSSLRAYLAEKGRLPQSLEELKSAGIPLPPADLVAAGEIDFLPKAVTITATYPSLPSQSLRQSPWPKSTWADESTLGKLVYKVEAPTK